MDPKDFKGISNEAARALLLERVREALAEQAKPDESRRRGPLAGVLAGLRRGVRATCAPFRRTLEGFEALRGAHSDWREQ